MFAPSLLIGAHAGDLRSVVTALAGVGPRNSQHYEALCAARDLVGEKVCIAGYEPALQTYEANGRLFSNIVAQQNGFASPENIVVVGAHYDTHKNSPGANDNGLAVAALLALARLAGERMSRLTGWSLRDLLANFCHVRTALFYWAGRPVVCGFRRSALLASCLPITHPAAAPSTP
jgi:hypothetical protein